MSVNQEEKKTFVPFLPIPSLQFFGEGEGGEGGQGEGGAGEGASGEGAQGGQGDGGQAGGNGEGGQQNPPAGKSFTQEDVNAIAAREAKKAQEKLLKQLGVNDVNSAKEGLAKFKELQDAQKSEAQKAQERAQQLEQQNQTALQEAENLKAQVSAMKAGVNADSVDDVVVLAKNLVNDETDMDTAIKKVIEKYPNFKAQAQSQEGANGEGGQQGQGNTQKPNFSTGQHGQQGNPKPNEADAWVNAFAWGKKS